MADSGECILCGLNAQIKVINAFSQFRYVCPNCGTFRVSRIFNDKDEDTHSRLPKHILSGYARELSDDGNEAYFSMDTIQSILDSPLIPQTPLEKLDKLLLWYYKQSDFFGKNIMVLNAPGNMLCC